jgi:SEC-C motif
MMAFEMAFPDVARKETRIISSFNHSELPPGNFLFREFYCNEPRCACRRVILQVHWAEGKRIAATINYGFDPTAPPFEDEPQATLDPLNPQSDLADVLLRMFEENISTDHVYRERLIRHYEMWRAVVDDPAHPDHSKVRSREHDNPSFQPAFPAQPPVRRDAPKVSPNAPCPCGSGKKHKRCCLS